MAERPIRGSFHWLVYCDLVCALKLHSGGKRARCEAIKMVRLNRGLTKRHVLSIYRRYVAPQRASGLKIRELF